MPVYQDKPTAASGGITFAAQDSLPRLPIPDLEQSCRQYLDALRPLQSAKEHLGTSLAVEDFLRGDGPELQEKLKKYASDKTSYIEQFWYDSYLNFDNPVVLNLNPFFLLEDDPTPARNNQVTRAASLVVSALEFVRAVRREELPPDRIKGRPLCMYQYSRLFGTARVPTESGCHIEQDPASRHIVVLSHGQFYWFDVFDDRSDLVMTERDLSVNLQTILHDSAQTPIQEAALGAVGVLSTENRKVWSGLRADVLTKEPGSNNADCLRIVDSALFVLCLDYTEPADADAVCQNMLCGTSVVERGVQTGTCTNRWYDKLQIIVCRNGSAGINFEHTGVDGHTVLRFASDVYTDTILRFARTINGQAPTLWASTSPDPSRRDPAGLDDVSPTPRRLEWDMTPELKIAVRFAESRLADLIGQNEFRCLDFSAYGKLFITSMGCSPDAFVQMAFQAAYYGLYGSVESTYEPAMTKFFLHGRTEAIRSVSDHSADFVKTFWADNRPEQKVDALRRACQRHVDSTRECAKAQGCDRHLYALLSVWQRHVGEEEDGEKDMSGAPRSPSPEVAPVDRDSWEPVQNHPQHGRTHARTRSCDSGGVSGGSGGSNSAPPLPSLFADGGWDKLNTTILSTSNCGNPSLRHFGFGPTSGAGFGIGYIIKDNCLSICVSSRHRQTKRFVDTLESYLLEIRRVLRLTAATAAAAAAKKKTSLKPGMSPVADGRSTASAEAEARRPKKSESGDDGGGEGPMLKARIKPRGRLITTPGHATPTDEMKIDENAELGGYGFFDAGMLLSALKGRENDNEDGELKPAERAAVRAQRGVGKKLRLIEY